jgi:NDP-sugar pyrophosphorylase family protein
MMDLTLVVLAAGMGRRYGGLKQIDGIGPAGEAIIDYSLYDAHRAGFGKVVFVIRREFEDVFKGTVGSRVPSGMTVDYAFQELDALPVDFSVPEARTKPWGTAHALLVCRDVVTGPFAVINADDFYGRESYEVLAAHLSNSVGQARPYCMVGFDLMNTLSDHGPVSRGICQVSSDGLLESIVEHTDITTESLPDMGLTGGAVLASMNMWGLTPDLFSELEVQFTEFLTAHSGDMKAEFYIPTVIDNLIRSAGTRVAVLETSSRWFGITYAEDRALTEEKVQELVSEGVYPEKLGN